MSKAKQAFAPSTDAGSLPIETVFASSRSPITVAVMGRAVLVELAHDFDLLVLVLDTGPIAHVCQKGRVVARVPMPAC